MVEDPEPHLLELLHTIIERYPEEASCIEEDDLDSVQVSCSLHHHEEGHRVNIDGFGILELVEGAMGTTLQKVEEIEVNNFWNENVIDFSLVSIFMARINRQNEPVKKVKINEVELLANAGIIATLLQNSEEWEIKELELQRDFGEEGWSWLAENLRRNKDPFHTIWLSKVVMARAKREDLKAIWDQNRGCQWWLEVHSPSPGSLPMKDLGRFSERDIFVGGETVEISHGKIVDPAWLEIQLIIENVKAKRMMKKVKSEIKQMEEELVAALQEPKEEKQEKQEPEQYFLQKLSQIKQTLGLF